MAKRSRAFQVAMWAYIGVTLVGVAFAMWHGASFFRAMRQAQMQFSAVQQQGDIAAYADFVNQVIAGWPERVAAFAPDIETGLAICFFFIIGSIFFALARARPRGVPLDPARQLARERLDEACRLAESWPAIRIRTDGLDEAVRIGDTIYLPREVDQLLDRKLTENVPRQLAFLIRHEDAHYRTSDNLLRSLGLCLIFTIIVVGVTFLATPVIFAITTALPDSAVRAAPTYVSLGIAGLAGAIAMGLFGTIIYGVFANLAVMQEFFADASAASEIGIDALPYDGVGDAERRGGIATAWATAVPAPDRRLHALGVTPRTGALMASAIAMWIVVRTLILIVHPSPLAWPVWTFDAACLGSLMLLLWTPPARAKGARDYGLPAIIGALALSLAIPALFIQLHQFALDHGTRSFMSAPWVYTVMLPGLLIASAGLALHLIRRRDRPGLATTDRLPPKGGGILKLGLLLLATPAYTVSFVLGMLALFTMAVTLADWIVSDMTTEEIVVSIVFFLICAITALFISKNIVAPSVNSIAIEMLWALILLAPIVYTILVMRIVAASSPPGNAGPVLDISLFVATFQAMPRELVSLSAIVTVALGVAISLSWIGRVFLISAKS